jgi:hypothetical protein
LIATVPQKLQFGGQFFSIVGREAAKLELIAIAEETAHLSQMIR